MSTTENNFIDETPTIPTSTVSDNTSSLPWIGSIDRLDRALSSSLWHLSYKIIDIVLLSLGLYYGTKTNSTSNTLSQISICALVFTALELLVILIGFVGNFSFRRMTFSEERNPNGYLIAGYLRILCLCAKVIIVYTGTKHVLNSKVQIPDNNREILRFYLGLVCFSTWWLAIVFPPSKYLVPRRRPLLTEIVIFLSKNIFFVIYIGFVLRPMLENQVIECQFTHIKDLYFHAPLKPFAFVGVTLLSLSIGTSLLYGINAQLYCRYPNLRRISVRLSVLIFVIAQLITLAYVYYLSVGAMLLFQPRSGGSCARKARKLFEVLHSWQVMQFLFPLLFWLSTILIRSVGNIIGLGLAVCLPSYITVPLLEFLSYNRTDIPVPSNPAASPGNIDALPMIIFGQASDKFDQTTCTICLAEFDASEEVKRLPCGHFFHQDCVGHWLSTTRICPVCRQRVNLQRL